MAEFAEAASRLAGAAALLLGWRPDEFWGATPAELAAVLAAAKGETAAALDRAGLERLMEVHPDG
ncbi:MAG: hypothetical protein QOJ94_1642 [Sphingomonadales bacterium]|jgi:uncharacterized phage protein (TIGR02216 family)|nr:hypothetical protein [Sphingomonadales bacterium]